MIHNIIKNIRYFRKIDDSQLEYLPQAIQLEEAANPYLIRITLYIISTSFFIFLVWASITEVNEVTVSSGVVIPKGRIQKIQHLDGGIITDILVQEGQIVDKSQKLVRLEDGKVKHDLAESKIRHVNLKLQKERVKAFVENRDLDFSNIKNANQEDLKEQYSLYENTVKNLEKEQDIIQNQIQQKSNSIESLAEQKTVLENKFKLAVEGMKVQRNLYKKGLVSKLVLLDYKKETNSIRGDINKIIKEIEKAKIAKVESENRLKALESNFKKREYSELERINTLLKQENENIEKLKSRLARQFLKSPVKGVVKGINFFTEGEILQAGKTILEVVPLTDELYVDLNIAPKDIGHLKIGQEVHIKFNSYDFSRYGMMKAKLKIVSATTFIDKDGNPYYKAKADLKRNFLGRSPASNLIIPGMTIQASIITGKKTVLSYLLKPIHRSMTSALTER